MTRQYLQTEEDVLLLGLCPSFAEDQQRLPPAQIRQSPRDKAMIAARESHRANCRENAAVASLSGRPSR